MKNDQQANWKKKKKKFLYDSRVDKIKPLDPFYKPNKGKQKGRLIHRMVVCRSDGAEKLIELGFGIGVHADYDD